MRRVALREDCDATSRSCAHLASNHTNAPPASPLISSCPPLPCPAVLAFPACLPVCPCLPAFHPSLYIFYSCFILFFFFLPSISLILLYLSSVPALLCLALPSLSACLCVPAFLPSIPPSISLFLYFSPFLRSFHLSDSALFLLYSSSFLTLPSLYLLLTFTLLLH